MTAEERKAIPVFTGFYKYFPRAIRAVAEVSYAGNQQHHPGTPVHWDKTKSTDEEDAGERHMLDHAQGILYDTDGKLHLAKHAWRAMSALERFLEAQENAKK